MAYFFVDNPGYLSNNTRLKRLNSLVYELESLPNSWGKVSTHYFMRDFSSFLSYNYDDYNDIQEEEFATILPKNITTIKTKNLYEIIINSDDIVDFLKLPEYSHWKGFLKLEYNKNQMILKSFFFTTAYHGQNLNDWSKRANLLARLRSIVDKYNEFNVTVFQDQGIFLDLVHNMPTDMWQSALGTVVCMGAICLIFMQSINTVFVTTCIIASIFTCALGILSWTKATMDPILMAAMIISIGFSVDIPAHVAYHFHTAPSTFLHKSVIQEKIVESMTSVGFPAIQASLSTTLCVLSLIFVPIYMSHVFVKTMILCIVLCIIHSFVILPAVLVLTNHISNEIKKLCYRKSYTIY